MTIETPDWVRDAVFYQVFPDRFAASPRVRKPGPLEPWDAPPTTTGFKGGGSNPRPFNAFQLLSFAPETLTAILNEEPSGLADSGANVPPALDRVIRRCLERVPAVRFASAGEAVVALVPGERVERRARGDTALHRRPEQFREDLRRARRAIEDACGRRIVGYRAPSFSITRKSLWEKRKKWGIPRER